jgi:phosphomannomutase
MSGKFAEEAAKVMKNNGMDVILSDRPTPTPALSFIVKSRKLDLGIMITASHNPAEYNGFKIKNSAGGGASKELTNQVESLLGKNPVKDQSPDGPVKAVDIVRDYIKFIRSYVDLRKIKNKKFRVLVDSMYGSGDSFIAQVLKGTNIKLEFMRNTVNPSFGGGRPEPVEENLKELKERVKNEKFDLGIALDGDADRIAAVAPGGVFVHPQKILGLRLHLTRTGIGAAGGKDNLRHDDDGQYRQIPGIKLYETPVGFIYISNLMETEDIVAGGEEAAAWASKGISRSATGTMAGLLLIEMMVYRNKDMLKN